MRTFAQKSKVTQQTTSAKSTKPSQAFWSQSHDVHAILHLQRAIGNQATLRFIEASAEEREDSPPTSSWSRYTHDFSRIPLHAKVHAEIQPKLTLNNPGDIYEQEADRVANQVLHQKIPEKEQTQNVEIKAKVANIDRNINQDLENQLNRSKGRGRQLSQSTRSFFEPRMPYDFSKVRVHTDNEAAQMNQKLGAQAFTNGRDIYFGAGQYNRQSTEGKRLLAHELPHVIQQRNDNSIIQRQQSKRKTKRYFPPVDKFLRQIPVPATGAKDIPDSNIKETQEYRDLTDPYLKWQWHKEYKGRVTKRVALLACRLMLDYRNEIGKKINWETEASRFVKQAIFKIEEKEIEEDMEFRRELFEEDLPEIVISDMLSMGWREAAELLETWSKRPTAIASNYSEPITNVIKMDWVLKFARAKSVYEKIIKERIWTNPASLKRIGEFQKQKPNVVGQPVGDLSKPVTVIDKEWINSRPVGSWHDFDALAGALGRFHLQVAIAGKVLAIATWAEIMQVSIEEVGIYVKKSFDFNGSQFLGFWGYRDDPVSNVDFRNWRERNKTGSDFLIFSDVKRTRLTKPDKVWVWI
jgi:hypothetical protein